MLKATFCVSLLSLVISGWVFFTRARPAPNYSKENLKVAVEDALAIREKEMVSRLRPQFKMAFADMGIGSGAANDPQTLEELLEPLLQMIQMMEGGQ